MFLAMKNAQEKSKTYTIAEISEKEYEYFVLKEEEKFGIIDKSGEIIIPANYSKVIIPNPSKPVFICYENENTKVLNEKNKEIYAEFQKIEPLMLKNVSTNLIYEKTVLKYEKDGKYGLISLDGKKITNANYEEIDTLQYKEGELLIKQQGKYGVININGYEIIKPEYDQIQADRYYSSENGYQKDGYIISNKTEEGYRYGYINYEGKKLLDTKYNELERISYKNENEIYLICAENGKYGLYQGAKENIKNEYQSITYVDGNEFCIVQKGKKYGVITLQGSMLLQVKYLQINVTGDYIYVTDENSEKKVYDKKANETEINPNQVIISVSKEKKYKVHIDTANEKTIYSIYEDEKKLTTEDYNYIEYLFEDYFIASNQEGKIGIIDQNGNIKVEMKYDSLQKIANTQLIQAIISSNKTTEIYTKEMKKTVEMENAIIEKDNNIIRIYNNQEVKYLDLEGNEKENKEVFPENNLYAKEEEGKWGFIGKEGNIVVDYQFDEVTELNQYGFAGVKKDGKWGVIDQNGNIIVDNKYELNIQGKPNFIHEYYKVSYGNGESYYTK